MLQFGPQEMNHGCKGLNILNGKFLYKNLGGGGFLKSENFTHYSLINGKNLTLFLRGFFHGFKNLPSYERNLCIQETLVIYTQYYGSYK